MPGQLLFEKAPQQLVAGDDPNFERNRLAEHLGGASMTLMVEHLKS